MLQNFNELYRKCGGLLPAKVSSPLAWKKKIISGRRSGFFFYAEGQL
jgi:hypothetical protein